MAQVYGDNVPLQRPTMLRLIFAFLLLSCPALAATHGLALYGEPKYPADFKSFSYVNPDAPKGGSFKMGAIGSFDSLNPFIVKGEAADGITQTFATLLEPSLDEPFSAYGYAADAVELAADRGSVSFTLRPGITFHDGSPITAQDIVWTFETLKAKGSPFYRGYYGAVAQAEALDATHVKFTFANKDNRELPLIIGQMPILSKASFKDKDFTATTLSPLMGSGPYKVTQADAGRSITLERVKGWWGESLPTMRGRHNFDRLTYDYYRDPTVAFEAFLAGKLDFRAENIAKNWATAYDALPAVKDGRLIKKELPNGLPSPMQGYVFNLRRDLFKDARVREALGYAFDFEWSNKSLAFGAYTRTRSYFDNTDLAATGLPSPDEMKLLEPLRTQLPERVFMAEYNPPKTDASGTNRAGLQKALALLTDAGWGLKDGKLLNTKGEQFIFEITDGSPLLERWVQPFLRNLERLGIKASYRVIDSAQYQRRLNDFDFDVTMGVYPQSLSPGNEQSDYWGSDRADLPGSRNIMGIKNPAVDQLVASLIATQTREQLLTAAHALDRVLSWNFYVIPHWHIGKYRLAYWNRLAMPANSPPYGLAVDSWWSKQ